MSTGLRGGVIETMVYLLLNFYSKNTGSKGQNQTMTNSDTVTDVHAVNNIPTCSQNVKSGKDC